MPIDLPIAVLAGLGAGLTLGLFGASAVNVIAPVLILVLGLPPYQAIGLSLGADFVGSIGAAKVYHRFENVRLRPVLPLLLASLAGAALGSALSRGIPDAELSGATGIGVLLTGAAFLRAALVGKGKGLDLSRWLPASWRESARLRLALEAGAGLAIGFVAGILGAGGGLLILLILSFVFAYTMHQAIGTAIVIMACIALIGCVAHFLYQPFSTVLACAVAAGALVGAALSALVANRLRERTLRWIAGSAFTLLGAGLLARALLTRL